MVNKIIVAYLGGFWNDKRMREGDDRDGGKG